MIQEEFLVVEKLYDQLEHSVIREWLCKTVSVLFQGVCVCNEVHSYVTLMTLNIWIFCYLNL